MDYLLLLLHVHRRCATSSCHLIRKEWTKASSFFLPEIDGMTTNLPFPILDVIWTSCLKLTISSCLQLKPAARQHQCYADPIRFNINLSKLLWHVPYLEEKKPKSMKIINMKKVSTIWLPNVIANKEWSSLDLFYMHGCM